MDSGYYAAMTGLVARSQALDTAAANLANAQTPGYRAEREFFRSVLLGPDAADSQLGQAVNNFGLLGGDRLSQAQGALQQTGNPLDLAIEGQGFFAVQTPNGIRYTRDGSFHRSQKGLLVTPQMSRYFPRPASRFPFHRGSLGRSRRSALGGWRGSRHFGVFAFPDATELSPKGRIAISRRMESNLNVRRTPRSTRALSRAPTRMSCRARWT